LSSATSPTSLAVDDAVDDADAEDRALRATFPKAPPIVFPHVEGQFILGDGAKQRVDADTVIAALWPVVSERRRARIAAVVRARTYSFLPVLEGTYDMGNISATARSCDAMGVGCVHIVATEGMRFKRSRRTSKGADVWLDPWRWRGDTGGAMQRLKEQGFRVLVARPSPRALPMAEVNLGGPRTGGPPTAVVFGNEQAGVSDEAVAAADGEIVVPMAGFSESLNVSVAASLVLAEAFRQRGGRGDLPPDQARLLTASYLLRAVRGRDMRWLLWLSPEQAAEEEAERAEEAARPPGWRRKLHEKRAARAARAAEGDEWEAPGASSSPSSPPSPSSPSFPSSLLLPFASSGADNDGVEDEAGDPLTPEEAGRVAAALEGLRRAGG